MGRVWLADDRLLGRKVALKEVFDSADPSLAERIQREARLAATLQHPNAVAAHDLVSENQTHFLVMEYVDGETLADRVRRRGPLAPREVAELMTGLCSAIAAAHHQGILHRDIKPSNILIDQLGVVKVTDFGIARSVDQSEPALTGIGMAVGTVHFMAPEVAMGHPASPASDMYAIGATMFAALEGHTPLAAGGAPDSTAAQLLRLVNSPAPTPRRAGPLTELVSSLLAPEPRVRPSATRAREILAEVAGGATPAASQGPQMTAGRAALSDAPTELAAPAPAPAGGLPPRPPSGYAVAGPDPLERSLPGRAGTIVLTILFGAWAAFLAHANTKRAAALGVTTNRYWKAFWVTIAASALVPVLALGAVLVGLISVPFYQTSATSVRGAAPVVTTRVQVGRPQSSAQAPAAEPAPVPSASVRRAGDPPLRPASPVVVVQSSPGTACDTSGALAGYGSYPASICKIWKPAGGLVTGSGLSTGQRPVACQADLAIPNPLYAANQTNTWWVWMQSDNGTWDWFPETAVSQGGPDLPVNGVALCHL